jgi:hypothetical protein
MNSFAGTGAGCRAERRVVFHLAPTARRPPSQNRLRRSDGFNYHDPEREATARRNEVDHPLDSARKADAEELGRRSVSSAAAGAADRGMAAATPEKDFRE